MKWYHQFIQDAPEELNGFIATLVIPGPPFPESLHKNSFAELYGVMLVTWKSGRSL